MRLNNMAHPKESWIYELVVKERAKNSLYYFETDKIIFTEQYHINRGSCCGNGCRHCPYDPKHQHGTTKLNESYESKN